MSPKTELGRPGGFWNLFESRIGAIAEPFGLAHGARGWALAVSFSIRPDAAFTTNPGNLAASRLSRQPSRRARLFGPSMCVLRRQTVRPTAAAAESPAEPVRATPRWRPLMSRTDGRLHNVTTYLRSLPSKKHCVCRIYVLWIDPVADWCVEPKRCVCANANQCAEKKPTLSSELSTAT